MYLSFFKFHSTKIKHYLGHQTNILTYIAYSLLLELNYTHYDGR